MSGMVFQRERAGDIPGGGKERDGSYSKDSLPFRACAFVTHRVACQTFWLTPIPAGSSRFARLVPPVVSAICIDRRPFEGGAGASGTTACGSEAPRPHQHGSTSDLPSLDAWVRRRSDELGTEAVCSTMHTFVLWVLIRFPRFRPSDGTTATPAADHYTEIDFTSSSSRSFSPSLPSCRSAESQRTACEPCRVLAKVGHLGCP